MGGKVTAENAQCRECGGRYRLFLSRAVLFSHHPVCFFSWSQYSHRMTKLPAAQIWLSTASMGGQKKRKGAGDLRFPLATPSLGSLPVAGGLALKEKEKAQESMSWLRFSFIYMHEKILESASRHAGLERKTKRTK